jgi:murein DD-endopeptidase MepM/ murein hydrolase activator NlpD
MRGIIRHRRRWRLALIVVAGGLTAACSTYRPLDGGSKVPWAKVGEVPVHTASAASTSVAKAAPAAASLPANCYVVQRGDQLGGLASSLGVSVRALAEANQLKAPYVIYAGQVLRIPEGAPAAAPEEQQVAVPADVQVAQLDDGQIADVASAVSPAAAPPTPPSDHYLVRRGDTLWAIAHQVDVPLVQLVAANQIHSPYDVFAGQKLWIPRPDSSSAQTAPAARAVAHRHGTEPPPLSGRGFLWPVNGKVIGDFGRIKEGQRRDGIDIAARDGAPVLAAEDGLVAYAGEGVHGYGRLILLRHGDGYISTYAHNAALLVEAGDLVERGQVIARVGSTGDAPRSMLHFELRKGRKPIDPETVLVREPTAVASTE